MALLTSKFRHAAPEQRFLDEAKSELARKVGPNTRKIIRNLSPNTAI
jgi:hypothetical protein